MEQALNSNYYHIVFYSKAYFSSDELIKIYDFIKELCDKNQIHLYDIGGTENHIHLLVQLSAELTIYEAAKLLKDSTSDFAIDSFKKSNDYVWKKGFGTFNVMPQHLSFISTYIKKQKQHHKTEFTFPELESINPDTL